MTMQNPQERNTMVEICSGEFAVWLERGNIVFFFNYFGFQPIRHLNKQYSHQTQKFKLVQVLLLHLPRLNGHFYLFELHLL